MFTVMCIPSQVEKEIKGNDRTIYMYMYIHLLLLLHNTHAYSPLCTYLLEVTKQQSCISVTSQLVT